VIVRVRATDAVWELPVHRRAVLPDAGSQDPAALDCCVREADAAVEGPVVRELRL